MINNWWEKPLKKLSKKEWEMLCDGCGLCCLEKIRCEGVLYYTSISCNLFNKSQNNCNNYKSRFSLMPDCVDINKENILDIDWLPSTCSYILRRDNKDLPRWHKLCDKDRVFINEHPAKRLRNESILCLSEVTEEEFNNNWEKYILDI